MKKLKHVIKSQQFDQELLNKLFTITHEMERIKKSNLLENKIMATLFYEPSTRTRFSFESAMYNLGGRVISTENAREFSSAAKGETLEDTIRVVDGYSDIIVLRHFEIGSAERASKVSRVPVVNAGDGAGQHPTQALLDLYTIKKEINNVDNISIAMVGDLANGRTVRSLCYLLAKYNNVKMYFVAPTSLKMKDDIKGYLERHNIIFRETKDLNKVLPFVDVIYQTRIQKERFNTYEEYRRAKGVYIIDEKSLKLIKRDAVIMHPLPRVDEIKKEVDKDKRAAYFRQAEYGLYVRMALLKMVLTE